MVADFCLRTEDDGMPGLLVNISVIVLHLLHDGVMDGRASWSHGSSLLYGSLYCVQIYWFLYVTILDMVLPVPCRDIFSGN